MSEAFNTAQEVAKSFLQAYFQPGAVLYFC